jgi:hypothetical protein
MSIKVALVGFLSALSTLASPFEVAKLDPRDLYTQASCQDIVYGATSIASGQTCVGVKDGYLTVTANVQPGWTLNAVHILVGIAKPTITSPGQFPYGTHKGSCTISGLQATCSIPVQAAWRVCDRPLYIAVHVAADTPAGAHETGWGKGACYDDKGNCAKYWTFTTSCSCPVIYEYEPIVTTVSVAPQKRTQPIYCLRQEADSSRVPMSPPSPHLKSTRSRSLTQALPSLARMPMLLERRALLRRLPHWHLAGHLHQSGNDEPWETSRYDVLTQ